MKLNLTLAAAALMALPLLGQTAAEQLQKGIFAQESQGKIDDAIAIYRQLANSTLTPREVAAQAQYRLSQSLLQKGDIATATREMERLERDFSEYKNLISSLATQQGIHAVTPGLVFTPGTGIPPGMVPRPAGAVPPPPPEQIYNMNSRITVQGKVKQMTWINPTSWMTVDANGKDYRVQLTSPNTMLKGGVTRNTFKVDDEVIAQGATALDGTPTLYGFIITSATGQTLFDRLKAELAAKQALLEAEQQQVIELRSKDK